jgi:transposase
MEELTYQQLLEENKALREENAELKRKLKAAENKIRELERKVDLLLRKNFGSSSEKLNLEKSLEEQKSEEKIKEPQLGKEEASLLKEADPAKKTTQNRLQRGRASWPAEIKIVEEIVEPEEVKQSPENWRFIGAEVSELLDLEPAQFFCRRIIRPKYVRRDDPERAPVIAPMPPILKERCQASPGLLSAIIVGKYVDHLPLYRQEMIFEKRHDVKIPRQTMVRWIQLAAFWLKPIYEEMREDIMKSKYLQVDETPIKYLKPGHGKTKQGYFWCVHVPGKDVLYHWEISRAAKCLDNMIPKEFTGTIQCDAYGAYSSFAKSRDAPLTLAGCWAHARRNFYQAKEESPLRVMWILRQVAHLYAVEKKLRKANASAAQRAAMRAWQSRPIYQRLHRLFLLLKNSKRYLPSTGMGKAIDYALSNWKELGIYLDDGCLEIDNNLVENAIRPTAIGKKNWLFIGEADAGEVSAILYTIVESCRRHGIDPQDYLRDVLSRLPSMTNWQIKEVTPHAWALSQRAQSNPSLSLAA